VSANGDIFKYMNERRKFILDTIIKEHINTGAPVGSGVLVNKYKLDISPATVRNEMASLEDEGYIRQPHTSAGRIPTEKAYNLYIEDLAIKKLKQKEEELLKKSLTTRDEPGFKHVAKVMAQISGVAIFWSDQEQDLRYTGISNLFHQPEFSQVDLICDISEVIDEMEEAVSRAVATLDNGEKIMIGSDNPFSKDCGTILVKYKKGNEVGMFGILGPMRMDYEKNLELIRYVIKCITENNL